MGEVLGRWVRRLESPEAVSAGLALTWDVRTLTPEEARALKPGQSGVKRGSKSKASGSKGRSSGPQSPETPQLQPLHLQPHIHTHVHYACTNVRAAVRALDPHPGPQECLWNGTQWAGPWQLICQGGGPSALLLIGRLAGIYPIAVHVHWF